MAFLRDAVAPRLLDYSMTRPWLSAYRARLLAQARGAVLEIGFGSGVNLPHYPRETTSVTVMVAGSATDSRSRISPSKYPDPRSA